MTRYVKEVPFVNKGYLVFRQTKMILKRVRGWTSGQNLPIKNSSTIKQRKSMTINQVISLIGSKIILK